MEIFGEKINMAVPFKRGGIINEIGKNKTTFFHINILKVVKIIKNVYFQTCHDYSRHKEYLSNQHFF